MATITFTASSANLQRLVDATCLENGYDASEGLTKADFTKKFWVDQMKLMVIRFERIQKAQDYITANPIVDPDIT